MKRMLSSMLAAILLVMSTLTVFSEDAILAASGDNGAVYYVAVDGDDANDGSEAAPFATLSHGVSLLQPGDTLVLMAGHYSEALIVNGLEGTAANPIKIVGEDGATIGAHAYVGSPFWKNFTLSVTNSQYVEIGNIDFTFAGTPSTGDSYTVGIAGTDNVKLHHNYIRATGPVFAAIYLTANNDKLVLDGNYATGAGRAVYGTSLSNTTIVNNIFTQYWGLDLTNQVLTGNVISNNVFTGSDLHFYSGQYQDTVFTNNIYLGRPLADVVSGNTFGHNIVSSEDRRSSNTDFVASSADLFEPDTEYRLKQDSPAKGAGTAVGLLQFDRDGKARHGALDIGPYAYGSVYYLDANAPDGGDGQSEDTAFNQIAAANAALVPGAVLLIKHGSYSGNLALAGSGASDSQPTTIARLGPGVVSIHGGTEPAIALANMANVNVSGLTLASNGSAALLADGAINLDVSDSIFTTASFGIELTGNTRDSRIYGNTFAQANQKGIWIKDSTRNKIYNNLFDNYKNILNEDGSFTDTHIMNNVFVSRYGDGANMIMKGSNTGNIIANNIFRADGPSSIVTSDDAAGFYDAESNNLVDYNLYDSTSAGLGAGKPANEPNSVYGNPMFASATDFHLQTGSAAINRGTDMNAPALDRDGGIRYGKTDIGAYEYAGDSSAFYVVGQSPQGNGIPVTSSISITVSETVNADDGNFANNIAVTTTVDDSTVSVPGSFQTSDNNGDTVIAFTPSSPFNYDATYTVKVKKELASESQNYLPADVEWSFKTEAFIMSEYYISPSGSDSNLGTIDSPKRTMSSDLVAKLKAGDTVYFREGTYNGVIVMQTFSGTMDNPITFRNYQDENAVLTSDNGDYIIYLGHSRHIRIEGLTFAPNSSQVDSRGTAIRVDNHTAGRQSSSNITITRNHFINTSTSVAVRDLVNVGFGDFEISNNEMSVDSGWGLYFQEVKVQNGSYGKIFNNVIYDAARSLQLWGRSQNLLFYNNTFADVYDAVGGSGRYDVYPVQGTNNASVNPINISTDLVFKNNIFTKPIRTQLEGGKAIIDSEQNVLFDNNVYSIAGTERVTYNGSGSGPVLTLPQLQAGDSWSNQGRPLETNGVSGNVTFVDSKNDARIIFATNPAIGVATDVIVPGVSTPATDILGNPRALGEAGAYAYDSTFAFVGSNSGTADGSMTSPYPSITAAVQAGARNLQLLEGTYSTDETIDLSQGVEVGDVLIAPYRGEVVLNGNIDINGTDEQGVTIRNVTLAGAAIISGEQVTLDGNRITGTVTMNGATGAQIVNNLITEKAANGIVVTESEDSLIANNVIYNRQSAIVLNGDSAWNSVYNNTLYGNVDDVVVDVNAVDNTFRNNIFSTAIVSYANNSFDYNLYNADTISASDLDAVNEQNAVKASAAFINEKALDFRIYKLSAAVGAGLTDAVTLAKDINGIVRGNPSDIGAYAVTEIKNNYYVDGAIGNDSSAGTADAPFRTIGAALDVLRHGETIIVQAGVYTENIALTNRSGQAAGDYVIEANGDVTLNGRIILNQAAGVTVQGFKVAAGSNADGVELHDSPHATLDQLSISNVNRGIVAVNSPQLVVDQVGISQVAIGIKLDGDGAANTAKLSKVSIDGAEVAAIEASDFIDLTLETSLMRNSAAGVVGSGESGFVIVNNTFHNIEGYSLDVEQQAGNGTKLSLYNNIFSRSEKGQGAYVRIEKEWGFLSENNLYDANAGDRIVRYNGEDLTLAEAVAGGDETNGRTGSPLFVNAAGGDLHLSKGSDASRNGAQTISIVRSDGTEESVAAPAYDYAGTAYSRLGQDIGAYYSPYSMKTLHLAGEGAGLTDGDGSEDRPFRTLGQAIAAADSGDTIIIHKGIYKGRFDMNDKHGTADARITFKASEDPNHPLDLVNASLPGPIFVGKDAYEDPAVAPEFELMTKITNSSYITIEGLNVTGYRGAGIWTLDSDNLVLRDLNIWGIDTPEDITSGVQGLLVNSTNNSVFEDIRVWDIGQTRKSQADHGLYIGYGSNLVFDRIKVSNSPGGGIQFYAGDNYGIHGTDIVVKNSVFSESKYGMIIVGVKDMTVTNNTFYNSWSNDLYLDWNVRDNVFQNNIFYNDRTEEYDSEDGLIKPVVIGYQYNALQTHPDQTQTPMVVNNVFRNNMYEYKTFPANARHVFDIRSLADFMASENGAETGNRYSNMYTGNAGFKGTLNGITSDEEKAQLIFDDILDITSSSYAIDKGVAELAPAVDLLGRARVNKPDIGAYEFIPGTGGGDGGNSGGNNGGKGNSGQEPGSTETPETADTATAKVTFEELEALFEEAEIDRNSVQTITLHMDNQEGAIRYVQQLPVEALNQSNAHRRITVATPMGTVTVPSNMLEGNDIGTAEFVEIIVSQDNVNDLSNEQRNALDGKQSITVSVAVDGQEIPWSNREGQVTVSIDYDATPEQLQNPEDLVVWHIDDNGVVTPVTSGRFDPATGQVTFATTQSGLFAVAYIQRTFGDTAGYGWAEHAISVLASKGIINGKSSTVYDPGANITRADFIKILVAGLGLNANVTDNFDDISAEDYYYEAVGIAKKLGLTRGIGGNLFNPKGLITRQEMMVMVYNALQSVGKLSDEDAAGALDKFADTDSIAPYALSSIGKLVQENIVRGSGDRINPLKHASRAEGAVLIYSIYNK